MANRDSYDPGRNIGIREGDGARTTCRGGRQGATRLKKVLIISAVVAASLVLLVGVTLFALWRASQVVPEFYSDVLDDDSQRRQLASDTMIQKATVLASDVRKAGRWEAIFTEEELNGWLAVDLEQNHPGALPPEVVDPRVALEDGSLKLGCRTRWGGLETVLSLTMEVYLDEPGVVGLRLRNVRAGALPLPMADVLEQIGQLGGRQGYLVRWQQSGGDPVALIQVDPVVKGDKIVTIDNLELAEGEIYLSGTTDEPEPEDD